MSFIFVNKSVLMCRISDHRCLGCFHGLSRCYVLNCQFIKAMYSSSRQVLLNLLWPNDAIWRQRSRSTLVQVMACCLTVPSHFLNQCLLIIKGVLWYSPESKLTRSAPGLLFGDNTYKITATPSETKNYTRCALSWHHLHFRIRVATLAASVKQPTGQTWRIEVNKSHESNTNVNITQPMQGKAKHLHITCIIAFKIHLHYDIKTTRLHKHLFITFHYNDVIMGAIASQIITLTIVFSIDYSDAGQRKHQSSASLAIVRWIHRGPVNSPHKWPVTRKMFPFDDVIMSLVCWIQWQSSSDRNWEINFCWQQISHLDTIRILIWRKSIIMMDMSTGVLNIGKEEDGKRCVLKHLWMFRFPVANKGSYWLKKEMLEFNAMYTSPNIKKCFECALLETYN